MMNEEKKVTNNQKPKANTKKNTNTTKKQGTKSNNNKKKTVNKKVTTGKNTKVNQTKKESTVKTPAPKKTQPLEEKVKINYEPREVKVQDNVEFPENKYSNDGVKDARDVKNTIIFTAAEKENLDQVVRELREDKKQNETIEKDVVRSSFKKNAIIIIAVLMIAIVLLTVGYVVKDAKKGKKEELEAATLNSNIYEKIVQNSKERDDRLQNNKDNGNNEETEKPVDYSNIRTITLEEFEEKVLAHEKMVVLISKSTCYYCGIYEPIVNEELSAQEKSIYRINVQNMKKEEVAVLMGYYKFDTTPTLFYVDENGVVTDELVGSKPKETFAEWMQNK